MINKHVCLIMELYNLILLLIISNVLELMSENYKIWKERVLLHLGYADIDYAIMKDKPLAVTNDSSTPNIALYEHCEWSNHLYVMFIKTKIYSSICGSIEHHEKAYYLLKAIDEQVETSDKALANTL